MKSVVYRRALYHYDEIAPAGKMDIATVTGAFPITGRFLPCGFSLKEIQKFPNDTEQEWSLTSVGNARKGKMFNINRHIRKDDCVYGRGRKWRWQPKKNSKGFTFKDNEKYKQAATEKYGKTVMNEAEAKQKAGRNRSGRLLKSSSHSRTISKKAFRNGCRKWT